jgi:F420-dependent hydroxymycolic acid dehydrogenase
MELVHDPGTDMPEHTNPVKLQKTPPILFNRRRILKSACATALLSASGGPSSGGTSSHADPQPHGDRGGAKDLSRNLLGFMLPHEQFKVTELIELGVAAENAGFDLLATSDHLQPWQSNEGHSGLAWVTMSAIGARTKRVWMGTTVTCPTFRYAPPVVAEAFASLDLLYPGRIFLGVGSGEALNEEAGTGVWPKWPERSERLVEATEIIRKLWTGQQISHKGKYYTVNAKLYDPPTAPLPLLMAGNGPKAMYRCGKYADGLVTDGKTWKQHKAEFERGARDAGKDPSKIPVLVETYVVVGDKADAEKAANLWRFGPKAFKKYYNIRDPQEIQNLAQKEVPLEEVYADWPVSTKPEIHVKAIEELFSSGATIVNIHTGQTDQRRVIEFYGKNVIPKFAKS